MEMSGYMMFNPYQHLTEAFHMDLRQWGFVKTQLTADQLANIENGYGVKVGLAAKVWKKA